MAGAKAAEKEAQQKAEELEQTAKEVEKNTAEAIARKLLQNGVDIGFVADF